MMKTISIDVPDDVWAEVQRRAAQANSQASTIALTPEALASILVKVGLCFSNDPKPVSVASGESLDTALAREQKQRIETLAMHLADFLRMYLVKLDLARYTPDAQIQAGMESAIGAAIASGWCSAAHILCNGFSVSDLSKASLQVGEEFDYDIVKMG